jgi:hypothetical protein
MTTSQTPAWRLVPVEPTPEMIAAYISAPDQTRPRFADAVAVCLRAAIAASPSPELPAERARLADAVRTLAELTTDYARRIVGEDSGAAFLEAEKRLHAAIDQLAALPAPTPQAGPVALRCCSKHMGQPFTVTATAIAPARYVCPLCEPEEVRALAAAPTPASVQPVAVAWQCRLASNEMGWGSPTTRRRIADELAAAGYEVRALGVIDPTPAERVLPRLSEPAVLHAVTMAQTDAHKQGDKAFWLALAERLRLQWNAMGAAPATQATAAEEWQPIETAPKDKAVILGARGGVWIGKYLPVYGSGYVPDNPWSSLMLNHDHMGEKWCKPTHWTPLPAAPGPATLMANGPSKLTMSVEEAARILAADEPAASVATAETTVTAGTANSTICGTSAAASVAGLAGAVGWTITAPDGWTLTADKPIKLMVPAGEHLRKTDPVERARQERNLLEAIDENRQEYEKDMAALVSRFLSWPLPASVNCDRIASSPGAPNRSGTNLLNAHETRAMLDHVLGCQEGDRLAAKAASTRAGE